MNIEDLLRQYLSQAKVMQLATAEDNKPWVCNIHYFTDDDLNFYWISTLARKHSLHIVDNPNVGAAILVHQNTKEENYVIGVSVSGTAELIGSTVDKAIGEGYVQKQDKSPELLTDIESGRNAHKFYRLVPKEIVLFDSKNFPDEPRQVCTI